MEKDNIPMLELLLRPAFCVKDGKIVKINSSAAPFLLSEGTEILPLIQTGAEEYGAFQDGRLYLTLSIGGTVTDATVMVMDGMHLFILEPTPGKSELQALALAALELRLPLAGMMLSADNMCSNTPPEQAAQFNRRLYQMLRTVSNMSDAISFCESSPATEYVEICGLLEEILEKTVVLLQEMHISLHYELPNEAIVTVADQEKLERAVYNLLSNAIKHTPAGGSIHVRLQRKGRLYLSVTDGGQGISEAAKANVYTRYLRAPSLNDGQEGLGLGMVLIKATAQLHGGTVLIDHPADGGTRVTMTMALRHQKTATIRTPSLRIDYAGERDHALQELADVLPESLYRPDNLR